MSQVRVRAGRRLLLALPVLATLPAWSDGVAARAPGPAYEDRGTSPHVIEPRAATLQWSIGEPTGNEQYMLELMNRARSDPDAEADRVFADYGLPVVTSNVDHFLQLRPGVEYTRVENRDAFRSYSKKPPFAFSEKLIAAARGHSELLRQYDQQSHQIEDEDGVPLLDNQGHLVEKDLRGRIEDQGYSGANLAENVFAYTQDMLMGHAGFAIDWGQGVLVGETRPHLGHRLSLMAFDDSPSRNYAEVGVGVIHDPSNSNTVGPEIVTIDFARALTGPTSFVTGVCWDDKDLDGFYDPGEGVGGVRIDLDVGNTFAISSASGGYAIPVTGAPGLVHVTADGGATVIGVQTTTADMTGTSVKVDFAPPPDPPLPSMPEFVLAVPKPFDDAGPAEASVVVAAQAGESDLLGDIEVEMAIDHPERSEFKATLVGPTNAEVVLFDHGAPGVDLNGVVSRSLSPVQSLSAFVGLAYAGTWKLRLEDTVPGNAGTLTAFKLRIRPQWVRTIFSERSPLAVTKLKAKDSTKPLGDSVTFTAQVDTGGVALDATAPCDLRLRTADAARTVLAHVPVAATGIVYGSKGTSRTLVKGKLKGFDLAGPLPSEVLVELSIGGAVVTQTVPLKKGGYDAAKTPPKSPFFRIGSVTTKLVNGVPNYTVKGRVVTGAATVDTTGLEVRLGDFALRTTSPGFLVAGAKATYKNRVGLKKTTIDAKTGSFTIVIETAKDVRPGATLDLALRLGADGFYGAASVVPVESGTSLTY